MNGDEGPRDREVLTILLYASDRTTRQNIRLAWGARWQPTCCRYAYSRWQPRPL